VAQKGLKRCKGSGKILLGKSAETLSIAEIVAGNGYLPGRKGCSTEKLHVLQEIARGKMVSKQRGSLLTVHGTNGNHASPLAIVDRGIQEHYRRYPARGKIFGQLRNKLMRSQHRHIVPPAPCLDHPGKYRTGAIIPTKGISVANQHNHLSPEENQCPGRLLKRSFT
jgi:hypothetical protein